MATLGYEKQELKSEDTPNSVHWGNIYFPLNQFQYFNWEQYTMFVSLHLLSLLSVLGRPLI